MIYLTCVVRGQLDPIFSFKYEHKTEQGFTIKYNIIHVQILKCSFSGLCTTLFSSHENYNTTYNTCRCTRKLYTKRNNITKWSTELQKAIEVWKKNVTIIFANIRTSKSTYYLLYDKSYSKTQTTIIPFSILLQILASPAKKIGKIGGFSFKNGENRNRLKK